MMMTTWRIFWRLGDAPVVEAGGGVFVAVGCVDDAASDAVAVTSDVDVSLAAAVLVGAGAVGVDCRPHAAIRINVTNKPMTRE
jgi:hypothetical protein